VVHSDSAAGEPKEPLAQSRGFQVGVVWVVMLFALAIALGSFAL
jgi:hypothetical protein